MGAVDVAVEGDRVICKWTVAAEGVEATLLVTAGCVHIAGLCVHVSAARAPTLRLRPLLATALQDSDRTATLRKQWTQLVI